jgi:hypothetical protein
MSAKRGTIVAVDQNKYKFVIAVRISVVLLFLIIFYFKSNQNPGHNASIIYMIIGSIMIILIQSVTDQIISSDIQKIRFRSEYNFVVFCTSVYIFSVLIIFMRDIFLIMFPNIVCLFAGISAFIFGIIGVFFTFRIKVRS